MQNKTRLAPGETGQEYELKIYWNLIWPLISPPV